MSRYLIERLAPQQEAPNDQLRVRFTVDLPDLHDCHHAINFAMDWIKQHPTSPPTAFASLLQLIRNFLPPPPP